MRGRGDRRGARDQTKRPGPTAAQQFLSLVTTRGGSTFDAGRYTPSGGNILDFVCGVDATHKLTVNGTIAAPTAESTLANALAATFVTTNYAASNKPSTFFKCLHDGTGGNLFVVFTPSDTANRAIVSDRPATVSAENGFYLQHGFGGAARLVIGSVAAAGSIVDVTFGSAAAAGVGMSLMFSYAEASSPKRTAKKSGAAASTGAPSGTPDTGDPGASLYLGALSSGASSSAMRWAQLHFIPGVLSAGELALVQNYIQSTTGVAP